MDKIIEGSAASSPLWATLETYARGQIQQSSSSACSRRKWTPCSAARRANAAR